jgi:hypothetical protein
MVELRINREPPTQILIFTSSLLLIPAGVAVALKRWGDVVIISLQFVSALWFHTAHTPTSFYFDQASTSLLAVHSLLLARTTAITPFMFVLHFGYMTVVYGYGERNKCFCFHPDIIIADRYHSSIHILGMLVYTSSMILFLPYEANGIFGILDKI